MIYRIESSSNNFTFSDGESGYVGDTVNVACEFFVSGTGRGYKGRCVIKLHDPAISDEPQFAPYVARYFDFGNSTLDRSNELSEILYSIEWHVIRSKMAEDDKLEFLRRIRKTFGWLYSEQTFDEAVRLTPKYNRYNYPKSLTTMLEKYYRNEYPPEYPKGLTCMLERYLEYDATHSGTDEDTI